MVFGQKLSFAHLPDAQPFQQRNAQRKGQGKEGRSIADALQEATESAPSCPAPSMSPYLHIATLLPLRDTGTAPPPLPEPETDSRRRRRPLPSAVAPRCPEAEGAPRCATRVPTRPLAPCGAGACTLIVSA